MMRDLFDRWERVWHEGQFDLVSGCVRGSYIRHDQAGDRTVACEAYAVEIAKLRQERPGIRVVMYDRAFEGDRAWFRFAFKWTDPKQSGWRAVLPNRRRQACRDLAVDAAAWFGVERCRRSRA
jgi:hypothetical protein